MRLLAEGFRRFHEWQETLPDTLRVPMQTIESSWREALGEGGAEELFVGSRGTPAFQLLAWVAESLLPDPLSETAMTASESMIAQYFAVRIQDDIVDEGASRSLIYLERALWARALVLSMEASGHAEPMLRLWEEVTRDFNAAAMLDAQARSDFDGEWTDDLIALQGKKYLPMVIPLVALFYRADRASDVAELLALVEKMAVGLQLQNDLLGAHHDLSTGVSSPFLKAMRLTPGVDGADELASAIARSVSEGISLRYIDRIERAFDEAEEHLGHLSSDRLSKHLCDRRRAVGAIRTKQLFDSVVHRPRLVLDLEVTRRCNLNCEACFVRAHDVLDGVVDPAELSVELALEIVDELRGYNAVLHITGGEPFLYEGLWDVLERAEQLSVGEVTINTNGTLLDESTLGRLSSLQLDVHLLVSIDGPGEVHETTRGSRALSSALLALREAGRIGLRALPASILSRELVGFGLSRWRSWLSERIGDFPTLVLWPLFVLEGQSSSRHLVQSSLRPEDIADAARQIAMMHNAGDGVVIADYPIINPLLRRLGVPASELWQCQAGSQRLCVQADGSVSPCHPLRSPLELLVMGSVGGFVERSLQHPISRSLRSRQHAGCAECVDRTVCGSCQAAIAGRSLPLSSNDWLCQHALEALEGHDALLSDNSEETQNVQL